MDSGNVTFNSSHDSADFVYDADEFERFSVYRYCLKRRFLSRAKIESFPEIRNENDSTRNESTTRNENDAIRNKNAMRNENDAIRNENDAIKNENNAIRNENGTIKNETGTIKNENGTIKNENGPIKNGNCPAKMSNVTDGSFHRRQVRDGHSTQRFPTEPPRPLATLNISEHKMYLKLKSAYSNNKKLTGSLVEKQDLKTLADLEERVRQERNKVNEYLYGNACTIRREDYFHIHPEVKNYVSEILKEELQYCIRNHPKFYLTNKIIPLLFPGNQVKETPFTFIKVILKLGHAIPLLVPYTSNRCLMNVRCDTLKERFNPAEIGQNDVHSSKQHISRDNIARTLGAKYGADVVITLASLTTLMDNVLPRVEHNWEIPIIICEDQGANGVPYKCIYVEKAIPPSSLSVRDKNEIYYSYAVKYLFTPTSRPSRKYRGGGYTPPVIPDDIKPVSEEVQAEVDRKISDLTSFEDVCEISEKVCDLDTFGISVPKKPTSHPKVSPEAQNRVNDEGKPDIKSVKESKSSDDDDECDEDLDWLSNVKVALIRLADSSKAEENAGSGLEQCEIENLLNMGKADPVKNSDTPCMSPLSNADSEYDRLVIDCGEEKQSDISVSLPCEKEAAVIDETLEEVESTQFENCGEKMEQSEICSENETGSFQKRKRKIRQLLIESDNDSDDKNDVNCENSSKSAKKKCRLPSDTYQSPKAKKLLSPKYNLENSTAESPPQENPLDAILVSQHKMLNPEDKIDGDTEKIVPSQFIATDSMDETAKEYPQLLQDENVIYSLWRLGNMKVLLRSEVDSQISTSGHPSVPAFLFPKLEYQMKFGFEVTTPSELIKEWVALHTHPGSHLIKVRIDATRSSLAMLEEVNLPNLLKNKKDINPTHAVHQLYIILETLKNLPEGQYLLTHKKGDYTLTLQKAVPEPKPGAFDLHASINQRLESVDGIEDTDSTRKEVPWLPIDSSIPLPEQKRQNRIPGCFYPTGFRNTFKNRKNPQPQRKRPCNKMSSFS